VNARRLVRSLIVFAVVVAPLSALELPTIFSDEMVLQQGQALPVWGKAEPGSQVAVMFGNQSVEAVANAEGRWIATLAPESASAVPRTLEVSNSDKRIVFKDVLVGEVWLCSGQSNMQLTVAQSLNADITPIAGANPLLRLFLVDRVASLSPRFSANATWTAADPKSIASFSAVGFYFGSVLQATLGVPVGLIAASWGATPAIAWTRPAVLDKHPLFIQKVAEWDAGMQKFPERFAAYQAKCAEWNKSKGLALDAKVDHWSNPGAPKPPPFDPNGSNRPGNLANGMLATVAPFAIRGAIWYQGENDTEWVPEKYNERLALMVADWREWWNNPTLAFGVVQLASHKFPIDGPSDDPWPQLRESQRKFVRDDPHAGMAVALDVGEGNDIHPVDKETVGQRLARWALTDIYKKIKLRGGPEPVQATFSDKVTIRFDSVGSGLWVFNGGDLQGFTLAGADGVFHAAKAEIASKELVEVSSPAVTAPESVRYGWAINPRGANLSNKQRLPTGTFELKKTDVSNAP
jgi:sialate O-acetylesterase